MFDCRSDQRNLTGVYRRSHDFTEPHQNDSDIRIASFRIVWITSARKDLLPNLSVFVFRSFLSVVAMETVTVTFSETKCIVTA